MPSHRLALVAALVAALVGLAVPAAAPAATQCGNRIVGADVRRCPDGSLPRFVADEVKPSQAPATGAAPPATPMSAGSAPGGASAASEPGYYFGVWRTSVPGAVWTSPSPYPNQSWLHVSAGAAADDLIVRPDGSHVWQSYGGKRGRWERGDADYPIVLIDTVENKRWKVGADPRRSAGREIIVWDGRSLHYGGRR